MTIFSNIKSNSKFVLVLGFLFIFLYWFLFVFACKILENSEVIKLQNYDVKLNKIGIQRDEISSKTCNYMEFQMHIFEKLRSFVNDTSVLRSITCYCAQKKYGCAHLHLSEGRLRVK